MKNLLNSLKNISLTSKNNSLKNSLVKILIFIFFCGQVQMALGQGVVDSKANNLAIKNVQENNSNLVNQQAQNQQAQNQKTNAHHGKNLQGKNKKLADSSSVEKKLTNNNSKEKPTEKNINNQQ